MSYLLFLMLPRYHQAARLPRIELLRPELGLWGGVLLLLSFVFMSSAKFAPNLPVVQLPSNSNVCSTIRKIQIIFSLDAQKRLYMHASTPELQAKTIKLLAQDYGLSLSAEQLERLQQLPYLSSDVGQLPNWLATPDWERKNILNGIPYSASNDQLSALLQATQQAGLAIYQHRPVVCLRLDQRLRASVVMPFLQQLQAQGINHYTLITESE